MIEALVIFGVIGVLILASLIVEPKYTPKSHDPDGYYHFHQGRFY